VFPVFFDEAIGALVRELLTDLQQNERAEPVGSLLDELYRALQHAVLVLLRYPRHGLAVVVVLDALDGADERKVYVVFIHRAQQPL
ncbi:hypothetical protein CYQ46_15490, partial [Enterococcus faecalis]